MEEPAKVGTLNCLLCGGTQIYPGPRYQNHLINEHGAVFDVEFLIKISLHKRDNGGKLPELGPHADNSAVEKPETCDVQVQTEQISIEKEENGVYNNDDNSTENDDDYADEVMGRLVMDMEEEDEEIDFSNSSDGEKVWVCPLCPAVFKRQGHFKTHACTAHEMSQADMDNITPVSMSEEEFLKRKEVAEEEEVSNGESEEKSKSKRKPTGKEWGPNSFSSTFTCYFCNEQFRKDYRLKLHLMLNHKNEPGSEMAKAKEVLTKAKLDGCVHRCALCGSKYNSVANFTRHIKDVHQITRAQYRAEYGSSEVVSRMFKCELCDKEVKHTRNIIGAHMKMVHLISWKEYQEILIKIRQGLTVGDLPAPELFECIICGVSVKYKREHLNKKHQITEDVYDELIAKKSRGEDISDVLPEREIYKCLICERECMDIKKHIERSHQITEEMYEEMVASKAGEAKRSVKQIQENGSEKRKSSIFEMLPASIGDSESSGTASPNMFNASGNGNQLSTDLQCYFGCDESFKKDYQLHLHLKLKHRNEDPQELAKAYEAAEEEIALTRRSASIFNCALCPKTFNDNGAFYGHIQTKHNMVWRDYKEQYGRCEVESAPFECKICGRIVKYDRNTVHTHLKNVHGINWAMYLDRIRRMRRGETPEDLPAPETHECRVCNVSVKYLKEHLKNAHKITEQEYESLFEDEPQQQPQQQQPQVTIQRQIPKPPPLTPKPQLKMRQPTPEVMIPHITVHDPSLPKPPKSDIQDKTNKTCSSCNITFDSRRSFIEHCTTVHNMRFKTKSGVTISGDTVQKRRQEEAMKRKAVELDQQQQPPAKKLALSEALDDGTTIIGNGGKRTLYTPSGVSKWNQCKYECCFCKRTTMSRSSMTSHIHNTHGIPIKEYKEANYPDIEVETNWFQCRLCPARTKFVKDCIAPHLKMSHNMDIDIYERDVMQPEDWPYQVIPEASLKHEMRGGQQTVAKPVKTTTPKVRNSPEPTVASSERDKWNRCKFACGLCDLVTVDSRQMRLHIATHHGLSMDAYTKQYGTTEIVTRKFRCELCNSEMKFCRQNIYAHMKDVHKITLSDYEGQIGVQALDIVPVEDQDGSVPASAPLRNRSQGKRGHASSAQPSANDEIVVEGIDPTTVAVTQGDDYVDSGLLDDGKKPSRWNKCRFRCAICGKLSSEKRHVREHIIKFHGLSLPDYETQYGDCEIHTEYFFCGVCHAEVKHNLKNISLHLQNVHAMSPAQYEASYGMIPEDEDDSQAEADFSFGGGGHFLLDDNVETYDNPLEAMKQPLIVDAPKTALLPVAQKPVSNPPKSDILNPKNKTCQPCNREFNRRQAFVEHCRTVHSMKIRFAKAATGTTIIDSKSFPNVPSATPKPAAGNSNTSGYPCQYCGKLFSNQSNRRRHAVLSCELARSYGVEPRKSRGEDSSPRKKTEKNSDDFYYEDGAPSSKSMEQKCPIPECEVSPMRSVLLKRHLSEAHDVHNVSDLNNVKTEPVDMLEIEQNDIADSDQDLDSSIDERKVPPLRVKISQVISQQPKQPKNHEAKPYVTCSFCNGFKSNNLYILGRHQKSCEKKMEAKKATIEPAIKNEESQAENHDETAEEHDEIAENHDETVENHDEILENHDESVENHDETVEEHDENMEEEAENTIEVPVDFVETADETENNEKIAQDHDDQEAKDNTTTTEETDANDET